MNKKEIIRHLEVGIIANLAAAALFANTAYFFEIPQLRFVASIIVVLSLGALAFVINWIMRFWKNIRCLGYYFLPTAVIFWVLNERSRRRNAEAENERLKEIIATWPDASIGIIAGIVDHKQQEKNLKKLLDQMDKMKDCHLATIVGRFRHYLREILKSVGNNGNRHLLKQVMMRLASYETNRYRETYKHFLWLLSDIFDPSLSADFDRQFQKHMIGPLKLTIEKADRLHAGRVQDIIAKIMADEENDHEIANSIVEMLLQLDWTEKREICRIIFDESVKRAFGFPKNFGIDFLNLLSRLEHRVFWLDIQSLRDILDESLNHREEGLINSNIGIYNELCLKVLAPVENLGCNGICNSRVYRRLTSDGSKVGIECISSDGLRCSCEGESLSFRGIYSKKCRKKVGAKLNMNIIPIQEIKASFTVKASITPLHSYESGSQGPGRGAFFEEAEPSVVRGLYEYVSTKK